MTDENKEDSNPEKGFSEEQKNYLQGYALGSDVAKVVRGLPVISDSARAASDAVVQVGPAGAQMIGPDAAMHQALQQTEADGGKLCNEEKAKRDKHMCDIWDDISKLSLIHI